MTVPTIITARLLYSPTFHTKKVEPSASCQSSTPPSRHPTVKKNCGPSSERQTHFQECTTQIFRNFQIHLDSKRSANIQVHPGATLGCIFITAFSLAMYSLKKTCTGWGKMFTFLTVIYCIQSEYCEDVILHTYTLAMVSQRAARWPAGLRVAGSIPGRGH